MNQLAIKENWGKYFENVEYIHGLASAMIDTSKLLACTGRIQTRKVRAIQKRIEEMAEELKEIRFDLFLDLNAPPEVMKTPIENKICKIIWDFAPPIKKTKK